MVEFHEQTLSIMGGEVNIYSSVLEAIPLIEDEIKRLVSIFNFFDERSLLSRLNAGEVIPYNEPLVFLIKKSQFFKEYSQGKFNIFLGKQILARKNQTQSAKIIDEDIKITQETISLDCASQIDLGGIAKGYIIDEAVALAKKNYPFIELLIDARGDCVSVGVDAKLIEIENPFEMGNSIMDISLPSGSIITSGHNKQQFKDGSHILGDRSDVYTITLKSTKNKCYELDALGTYLIQLHSEDILEKIAFDEYLCDIECLLVLDNGRVITSPFWN